MSKKGARLWETAYDKVVRNMPLSIREIAALELALYWCTHQGAAPWPIGPKQTWILEVKRKLRGW